MKKIILVITGLLWSESARAELDVQDFFRALALDRSKYELAIMSTENGMAWVNTDLKHNKQKQLYCAPEHLALTPGQLIQILRQEFKEQPRAGTLPLGYVLLKALQKTFPCKE